MNDVIILLCYPDMELKLNILRDQINDIHGSVPLPILLATHLPVPDDIIRQLDYFIYDKNDVPSNNYTTYYHYGVSGLSIKSQRDLPYHALSAYSSIKNATTFLRDKFKYAHFFEYDTMARYKEFTKVIHTKKVRFVGSNYEIPDQKLKGIYTSFFSFDIKWFDNKLPEIKTWDEYKSYGQNTGDYLLFENWLHNYFAAHKMIKDCYFLTPEEWNKCGIVVNIQTRRNKEPGLKAFLSELEDHRLIFFVCIYGGGILDATVNYNGSENVINLNGNIIYWKVIEKKGHIKVSTKEQTVEFDIDPQKEYTDTVFEFDDQKMRCLKEY